jgi:ribosomal protein S27AE
VAAQALVPGAAPVTAPPKDPTPDNPAPAAGEKAATQQGLDTDLQAALMEIRTRFKQQYQPKRIVFIRECMKSFEALRGNTYALLNDRNAALDTINELMQGLTDGGGDPASHDHNENIYQMFCLSFIAALMVNLGKVRYMPADADDEEDEEISKKGSTIQAYNERKNDEEALNQIKLLFLWCTGSFFRYVRYKVTEEAGMKYLPQIQVQKTQVSEDRYICPQCGTETPESAIPIFQNPTCPKCGAQLKQSDFFGGEFMDLPVKVGDLEVADGMTAFDIVSGMQVDANPDVLDIKDTEILDYQIETSAAKLRSAFPTMYDKISPAQGSDAASDGDAGRQARQLQTTPGSNQKPLTTEGLVTYSRCWITPEAFYQLEDKTLADRLKAKFPKGCKLSLCGDSVFLEAVPERLLEHWTWCGTIKGIGMYPFAVGKVVLDLQERITDVVNIEHAYLARLAFGTILYDADIIDGNALASRFLTPGNMTPVSRTDDETGTSKALSDIMYQPEFHVDPKIFEQSDRLTARAQLLAGILPQIFGGSDPHVETKGGQEQALNTALGRLKQFVNQMRGESARAARISVKCSVDNMDEELKIVEAGEQANTYQTIRLLRAELQGDFFTYPETAEGFPATYEQIQSRVMQLLTAKDLAPAVGNLLSDPDNAASVARYVLPDEMTLPGDEQRAKVKKVINRLAQGQPGVTLDPAGKPIPVPSIMPEPDVDDPKVCVAIAKKWLLKNFDQETTNRNGYMNVLAYLKVSARLAKQQMADAAVQAQQAQQAA